MSTLSATALYGLGSSTNVYESTLPTKSSLLPLAADHRSSHSAEDVEQWPSVKGEVRRHQWVNTL